MSRVQEEITVTTIGIRSTIDKNPRFALGMLRAVRQFRKGDWGDVGAEDAAANDANQLPGGSTYALGSYMSEGIKFWIIRDHKRDDPDEGFENEPHATTVLLPEEY